MSTTPMVSVPAGVVPTRSGVASVAVSDSTVRVSVWVIPLEIEVEAIAGLSAWLDVGELARARRYHFEHHRRRFIARRAARRLILGEYLGLSAREVPFREVGSGKPEIASSGDETLHFSASHSEELAVVAVSSDAPIGIDLEIYRTIERSLWEVRHLFSVCEKTALDRVAEHDRATVFFDLWTRKEACVKADGAGLEIGLDTFEVPTGPLGEGVRVCVTGGHKNGAMVTLRSVAVCEEAAIALAAEGTGTAIDVEARTWDWSHPLARSQGLLPACR